MILLRRYLVLAALFFWQGGFTFYASVVVPVGQQVFGHLRQGFVTREVTVWLNVAGAAALTILVWDLLVTQNPLKWRRRLRWLLWDGMVLTLVALAFLHGEMNDLLIPKGRIIRDADTFHSMHRIYLWISTVQWSFALFYLAVTLSVWRGEDRLQTAMSALSETEKLFQPGASDMNVQVKE